jgi:hypothetical protein
MKKALFLLSFAATLSSFTYAQVGIGTNTPSEKSVLDLTSKDKGFLLPRMTTAQRNAIAPNNTTDVGMQVFDETTNSIWMWNGAAWIQQGAKNIYDSNGDISPTASTNRSVNFSNGGSLNFDQNTLTMDATLHRVGVGTNNPLAALDVVSSETDDIGVGLSMRVLNNKQPAADLFSGLVFQPSINNQPALHGK